MSFDLLSLVRTVCLLVVAAYLLADRKSVV